MTKILKNDAAYEAFLKDHSPVGYGRREFGRKFLEWADEQEKQGVLIAAKHTKLSNYLYENKNIRVAMTTRVDIVADDSVYMRRLYKGGHALLYMHESDITENRK